MRGNPRGTSPQVSAGCAWLLGVVAALLVGQSTGCSREFGSCAESKTCPLPDAAVTDAASSGSGGQGNGGKPAGGTAGVTGAAGNGGGAVVETGGTTSGGGASAQPDGGGVPDGGAECSTVDGGISSDPDHCGSCSVVCSASGAVSRACVSGACTPVCAANYEDCNKKGADGCEANLRTDPDHCASCATACSSAGTAARTCGAGTCQPTCDTTHNDCNKNGADGCEVNLKTDPDHCGSCAKVCSALGTSARSCVNGVCRPTCDATHTDCNSDGADGCEIVDLQTNPDNCGACGFVCSGFQVAVGQRLCVAGACSTVCLSGRGDCGKPAPAPDDGCETNLSAQSDCGACGHSCLGGQCSAFACQEVVIASGLNLPGSITVTNSYLSWTDGGASDGRVMRANLPGGGITPIATPQSSPHDIENDGQYVYWVNAGGAVRRVNVSGPPAIQDLATSAELPPLPWSLALDASYVYVVGYAGNGVYRIPKDGSVVPQILIGGSLTNPTDVVVDSTFLYVAMGSRWVVAPIGGGPVNEFVIPGSISSTNLAVDGTSLFFRSYDPLTQTPAFSMIPGGVVAPARETVVAAVNPNDAGFTVDASYIYYSSDALYRVAKTGGTPQKLSGTVDGVAKIVVHAEGGGQAIYWVNRGRSDAATGRVLKLAL
jgi:hypothetical protein